MAFKTEPFECRGAVVLRGQNLVRNDGTRTVQCVVAWTRTPVCARAFTSSRGLSQHQRNAHKASYNAAINVERVKPRWDSEESYLLAKKEAELGPEIKNINQVLHSLFPSRTYESIKSHRKQPTYRELVASLAEERAAKVREELQRQRTACAPVLGSQMTSTTEAPGARPKSSRTRRGRAAGRPTVEDFLETLDTDEEDLDSSAKTTSDTNWSPNQRAPMGRGGVLASGGGDVVTPGGAVAHVAQQPRRSRFPLSAPGPPSFPTTDDVGGLMSRETSWTSWTSDQHLDATARASSPGPGANNLAPPAGDCSDPAAPLPPRVDIQDSAKQVADELRTLVSRAPPRSFQGPRLWDVARQALLGVDVCSQVDDYLRAVFRVPGPPRRQQHRNANQPGRESRRKKKKRDYATTQERFKKRQADCARSILDGPCAAKVTDGRGFLETWRGYMTGAPPAPPADPRLDGLRFSDHPGCAPALELPLLAGFRRRALAACRYQGQELLNKKLVQKMWTSLLHRSNDGAALRDCGKVPGAHRWVSEGTRLLRGRQFLNLIKLRINAMPTLERTSRGRGVDVSCRAGCRAPESLGHVLQCCHRGHRGRVKRHNNLARYVCNRLVQLGWTVLWEPHFPLPDGTLKPDLVAFKGQDTLILDAQVVGTGMGLGFLHHQKVAKYSGPLLQLAARAGRSGTLLTSTITLNFRGVWCPESARDLLSLGLTQNDLKLLSVRCLQGGLRCFWSHRTMTTAMRIAGDVP
ncbi:hypothetical protein HPB47_001137 [Ixodes persulcatus]|uniref:Uncharacterized protein n=1 Tax=Ixodes persulcatus TaxID=34615 RepID=A0AC60R2K7_IXOPE|nr:hypothetical protein HPB47_001137 [Ixodes persulcatus]